MRMLRPSLAFVCLASWFVVSTAWAVCPTTTLTGKDAAGATQTFCFGGASGAFIPQYQILDSAGTNLLAITASNAAKVDGSAVTQPISGTITANAGTNLNTSALALDTSVSGLSLAQGSTTSGEKGILSLGAVTTGAPAYTTAQSSPLSLTLAGGLRTDSSAVTQPISAASLPLPTGAATSANQSTVKAASTQSVAADTSTVVQINPNQPNLTTPLNVNMSQLGGTAVVINPCQSQTPAYKPISITSATTTVIVAGVSAKKTYICSINLFTALANNVAVIEGTTGTTCATAPVGVIGGATATNGLNIGANGGETYGSGVAAIAATATANDDLCIITSSAGPLAGVLTWVQL